MHPCRGARSERRRRTEHLPVLRHAARESPSRGSRGDRRSTRRGPACRAPRRFYEALPGGLDARVGARGLAVSGGEAQRIAIARAFLKNASIMILDEPTRPRRTLASEREILASLDTVCAGRTDPDDLSPRRHHQGRRPRRDPAGRNDPMTRRQLSLRLLSITRRVLPPLAASIAAASSS